MILLKIGDDGELQWNKEEIVEAAKMYDLGWRSEETEKAKLLQLVWEEGFNCAVDTMNELGQRTALLLGEVAGNA